MKHKKLLFWTSGLTLSHLLVILLTASVVVASFTVYNLYLDALPHSSTYTLESDGAGNFRAIRYDGKALWDSTNASQVLKNAVGNATGGAKVFLTDGTYPVSDIVVNNYTVIEGESREGTVLELNANSHLFKSHSNPLTASAWTYSVVIKNLKLDGKKATYTTGKNGIYGWFGYSKFLNLNITGFKGHNVNLTAPTGEVGYNNYFEDSFSTLSDGSGFYSVNNTDSYVLNNLIHNHAGHAVYIVGASWHIHSNYIGHTTADGSHGLYLESKGSMVTNNQIDWSYEDHIHLKDAWMCDIVANRFLIEGTTDTTRSCIELETSHRNSIIANHFDGVGATKGYAIKENGSPANTYNNTISGNSVDNSAITTQFCVIVGTSDERGNSWQPYGLISSPVVTTYLKFNGTGSIANNTAYTVSGCPKTIYMQDGGSFDVKVNGQLVFDDVTQAMVSLVAGDTFEIEWTSAMDILKVMGQ